VAEKADYRSTLNLPRTAFPMKGDLVKREPETLARWEQMRLYDAVRTARKGSRKFIFHDGPPFANGNSHIGHLLNNVLKDAVVRYKTAAGFDAPFVPGWDCHGQPIEYQYLKTSGLSIRDIKPLELRRACAEYAMKWVNVQKEQRKRMGMLADWERPYLTMDPAAEAVEIECAGRMIQDGYIVRGRKPVLWCATCETALAENSVEYGPHVAPSIFVRFRVSEWTPALAKLPIPGAKPAHVVIWTTTPWTLPANVALAFNRDLNYDLIETPDEILVLATDLAAGVMALAGIKGGRTFATAPGREFEGLKCDHPFVDRISVGVLAEYVTLEAGTGIVHTAPGHGEEDYVTGKEYRLPILAPVDAGGRFTDEFPEFKGRHVFESNRGIIDLLKGKGMLVHEGELEHSYPFCWRCKNPMIFRATEQWFISLDHNDLKKKSAEAARKVVWHPAEGGERAAKMVESRPDWCISRQRSWGVPIPVFYCDACGAVLATEESIKAVHDKVAAEGADVWWIREAEAILPADTRCPKCGERKFRKETDTLDVWFDSGTTHMSVLNARKDTDLSWPADLYLEGADQYRCWFQSSLLTAMALKGSPPFKEVVVHGIVVGAQGEKMSKSLGNTIDLEGAVGRWGADVMRLWALMEYYHDDMRLSEEIMARVVDAYRKLRNTLRFLLGALDGYDGVPPPDDAFREVDRWMRWRKDKMVAQVTGDMKDYRFYNGIHEIHRFCVSELSSFYLDLLKDRLYASRRDDPARRAAQAILAETLKDIVRLLAPFIPFTADEVWGHMPEFLRGGVASVHLALWPEEPPFLVEGGSGSRFRLFFFQVREAILKQMEIARQSGVISNPLESRIVLAATGELMAFLQSMGTDLPELLIASQVSLEPLDGGDPILVLPEGKLAITIVKPEGTKCPRCWLVKADIGSDPAHPDLCGRCADVVGRR
jgi:isoleucyl-tRNA synthetase